MEDQVTLVSHKSGLSSASSHQSSGVSLRTTKSTRKGKANNGVRFENQTQKKQIIY
jgi:hypothetical protein